MDLINDLKNSAQSVLGGDMVDNLLNMTDLDEKAIAMFDEKMGHGKFAEYKAMLADGKISKEEILKVATEAGVNETIVGLINKFM
jgi:hypothetical protein